MGHDIYGYQDKHQERQIAYLRRSAGNSQARDIYRALGAEDHDCGCSGCGDNPEFFSKKQLEEATGNIPSTESHRDERQFLKDCIDHGYDGAWIRFA